MPRKDAQTRQTTNTPKTITIGRTWPEKRISVTSWKKVTSKRKKGSRRHSQPASQSTTNHQTSHSSHQPPANNHKTLPTDYHPLLTKYQHQHQHPPLTLTPAPTPTHVSSISRLLFRYHFPGSCPIALAHSWPGRARREDFPPPPPTPKSASVSVYP